MTEKKGTLKISCTTDVLSNGTDILEEFIFTYPTNPVIPFLNVYPKDMKTHL